MTKIDIGRVGIWSMALETVPTAVAQAAVRDLESLGFPTVWIPEAVGREPFVEAATLLAATSTLRLATGIANIYARDPMTMVAAQKTLCEAYPNRFLLGIGVSHAHLVEHLRKHRYDKPLSYMRQYLDAMDEARFLAVGPEGETHRVLAALGPKMLELAAQRSDGAHPYFTPPEHTAMAREIMGPDALLAPEQMVVLETDATKAREVARAGIANYRRAPNYVNNLKRLGFDDSDFADTGSDRLVDALVAWGSPETIARRVAEHHDAGADHVCVQVLIDPQQRRLPSAEWAELAPALL